MGNYWVLQKVQNKNKFIKQFRMRLQDIYMHLQTWNEKVGISSEGRLFKHVKYNFGFEHYLNTLNMSLRVSISKIRLNLHAFFIDRGRWINVQKKERKCMKGCNLCKRVNTRVCFRVSACMCVYVCSEQALYIETGSDEEI